MTNITPNPFPPTASILQKWECSKFVEALCSVIVNHGRSGDSDLVKLGASKTIVRGADLECFICSSPKKLHAKEGMVTPCRSILGTNSHLHRLEKLQHRVLVTDE